jgi:hypothetical protein
MHFTALIWTRCAFANNSSHVTNKSCSGYSSGKVGAPPKSVHPCCVNFPKRCESVNGRERGRGSIGLSWMVGKVLHNTGGAKNILSTGKADSIVTSPIGYQINSQNKLKCASWIIWTMYSMKLPICQVLTLLQFIANPDFIKHELYHEFDSDVIVNCHIGNYNAWSSSAELSCTETAEWFCYAYATHLPALVLQEQLWHSCAR